MSAINPDSRRRPRRRHPVIWTVAIIVLVLLAGAAWIGVRGFLAQRNLSASVALVGTIKAQIQVGDAAGAQASASTLATRAAHARRLTSDPVWRLAEAAPIVGPDLQSVRRIAETVDTVASGAVRPLVGQAGKLSAASFKPSAGRVDLQPLVAAQPAVAKATAAMDSAKRQADAIDSAHLASPLQKAVGRLQETVSDADAQVRSIDDAVQLLPPMLGASGDRKYLLLFENNAELRAGGGIPGAVALLDVHDGAISLTSEVSGASFGVAQKPVLPLATDTQGLYGAITGEYMQDVTTTPRFDTSAQLARQMWKERFGQAVDGVVAIDPVTLSYMLQATGPVRLATGDTLNSSNAVQVLLSDTYSRYPDPTVQDAFFAGAASAVFTKISTGSFDSKGMLVALGRGVSERRVMLWSANASEQKTIATTPLAGGLPVSNDEVQRFGVYLNDAVGGKIDYYLRESVSVATVQCRRDGRPTWVVDVTLTNSAPANAATALPEYVTGGGASGVAPGTIKANVAVYAPETGGFVRVMGDGTMISPQTALDGGFPVVQAPIAVGPGKSAVLRYEFVGGKGLGDVPLAVTGTPGVHTLVTSPLAVSCAALRN